MQLTKPVFADNFNQVFGQAVGTIKVQIEGAAQKLEHNVFLKCSQPIKATKIGEV